MLLGEQHEVLIEIERGDHRRRVGRIADHHRDRLRRRVDQRPLERDEIFRRRLGRHRADDAAGDQEAEGVDRIGGVRRQHHVARRGDRLRHIGEAFLRAERGDDLGLRIELHAESPRVIAGLGAAQAGNAPGGGIAVGARLADGLDQLVDDVLGRGEVRVAHAEIDDVGPGGAGLGLELVDLLKDVRRQAPHPVKFRHRAIFPLSAMRRCGAGAETVTTAGKRAANLKRRRAGGAAGFRFDFAFFSAAAAATALARDGGKVAAQRVMALADRFEVAADRLDFLGALGLAGRLVGRGEDRDLRLRPGRARLLDEVGRRRRRRWRNPSLWRANEGARAIRLAAASPPGPARAQAASAVAAIARAATPPRRRLKIVEIAPKPVRSVFRRARPVARLRPRTSVWPSLKLPAYYV